MASFLRPRRKSPTRPSNKRRRIFETLERRQLLAGDVTLFADSFESGSNSNDWAGNWVEDSQNDWFRSTQRATDGVRSAEVDGRATDATLTLSNPIDLSGYSSAELTFDWLIERGFDSGEYLALDISSDGGASWTTSVLQLDGNSDPENQWHSETVDLTPYASSEVLVRFRSKVSRSNEDANIDNVTITGQTFQPAFNPSIEYVDFQNTGQLNLVAEAATTPDHRLRLTPAEGGQAGGAWHQEKQFVDVGWETEFQFQLTDGSNGADGGSDGFAFVIQNAGEHIIGNTGGKLGYHKMVNSLAIEFDTAQAGDEPSDSHVSVHTGGTGQNSNFHDASIGSFTTNGFKLDDGNVHRAKITYTPGTLSVYLDDLSTPSLTLPIDLGNVLDLDLGRAFVGFTAATGGGWNNHDILDWTFANTVDTASTVAIANTEVVEGNSGNATAEFEVVRMGDLSQAVTLDWSTSDGTAVAGADYVASSGQIYFAPGESTQAIAVPVVGDQAEETHEDFRVSLLVAVGDATIVAPTAIGTILNDETSLSVSDAAVTEGSDTYRFIDNFVQQEAGGWKAAGGLIHGSDGTLWLASNMPGAVLRFDADTGDFLDRFDSYPNSEYRWYRNMRFGPDGDLYLTSTKTNQILRVDGTSGDVSVFVDSQPGDFQFQELLFGDDGHLYVSANDEVLRFEGPLGSTPGAPMGAFVTAGDGGLSSIGAMMWDLNGDLLVSSNSLNGVLKYDGATGSFLSTFIGSDAGGLDNTMPGGMIFGADRTGDGVDDLYVSSRNSLESVLVFDGQSGDFNEELTPNGLGGISKPGGMLFDSDGNLLVVNVDEDRVLRYGVDSQAIFTVSLSQPSAIPVLVAFDTLGISADAGDDFQATSGTITFAPGVTSRTIIVLTFDDDAPENTETFQLALSNAVGADLVVSQATGTILDDGDVGNQAPTADAGADQNLSDNDGTGSETVTLSGSGFDSDGSIVGYQWTEGATVLGNTASISPSLGVGTHTLTLTVTDNEGATGSDTVVVTVNANQGPSANAGADQSVSDADGSGDQAVTLTGIGSDSDGSIASVQWTEGTTVLGNTTSVSPLLSVGTHTLTFTVTDNGGATASDIVIVTVAANQGPTADAGADQTVTDNDDNGSETVTLIGSGSDVDGSISSYRWSEGATVLGNTASISPTLSVGTHTLTLTVTDNGGATSSDNVVITVIEPVNQDPTANAGADQSLSDNDGTGGETVTLNGSGSDPDGSIASYQWTEGATVLGDTASISPTLSVGAHTLTLTVTDNDGATASDNVVVTVDANQGPTANAGVNQTLTDDDGNGSETVTLNGSGSDADGSIASYQWSEGATVLGNTASISPSLGVGTHTLTLTVTDNGGATATDTVVVNVAANQGPTADAGADQTVTDIDDNGSETVTLIGSGADADGTIASYQWTEGATVLGNTASISPSLTVGTHTLTLTVTDNGGASATDTVDVTIEAAASGPNLSHGELATVGSSWQTVTLVTSYTSMVVVATPRYNDGSGPGVVRIDNVTSSSFDVRVDNTGSSAFSGGVHYIAVEEGVYDEPGQYKLEAVKYSESQTSRKSGWVIDTASQDYQQDYNNPVVVGQVMSANDPDFSVFWASSGSRTSPPSSTALNVGKHVAEDPDTTRATETIGYLVIEATQSGTIEGLPFVAGVGGDSVRGVGNGTYQYGYDAMPNAKTAVLSSAGMDGGDGGWAVLRGNNPVPATSGTISLSIDEDQLRDSERNHTTEQVAYFIIDPPVGESSQSNETVPFSASLAGSPSGAKADSIQRDGLTAAEIPESSTKLVSSAPSPEIGKRQTRIELIDAALSESDNDWSASELADWLVSSLISRASFGSR